MRVLAAVLLALAACGGAQRTTDLMSDVREYNEGIRWQKFADSAMRLLPAERDDFLDEHERLADDLRVADYEVTRVGLEHGGELARVQVEWTWLLDSRGIVHTTVTRQSWKRYGKRWILTAEERLRGDPMPGVAEPRRPVRTSAENP
jgi:hypothetical protein